MSDLADGKEASRRWREIREAGDSPAVCIELCERYVRDFPDNGPAWAVYGSHLIQLSRFDEAEAAIRRAIELVPESKRAFLFCDMGQIFRFRGDAEASSGWFQRAMTEFPDDAQGYMYLGSMLAGSGQLQQAERIHRLGTSCKSGCIDEAFLNLGFVLRAQRRYAEAIECFDQAIKRDPQYEDAIAAREDCEGALRLMAERPPSYRA